MQKMLWDILSQNTSETEKSWLQNNSVSNPLELMTAFVACPRFLSKKIVSVDAIRAQQLADSLPGFSVEDWSLVRLARVWLLTHLDPSDKDAYIKSITTLFDTAELNELVALYSALPILAYPENWLFRATDAVRSNMGFVFDAIAMRNPYPAHNFNEPAWNQLVMKTIFNDKPIHFLYGLEEKRNQNLAQILSDFAHERWAAGRSVAPQVWRLITPFMDDALVDDMKHLLESKYEENRQVAAICCIESGYQPAIELIKNYPDLEKAVAGKQLQWSDFETKELNTYVPKP